MNKLQIDLSHIKAAIFDMDGTMINNMEYHQKAWAEFLKKYHISFTPEEFKEKISGKKNDQIFRMVFHQNLSDEEIKQYTEEKESLYRQMYEPALKEVDGLHQIIEELEKKRIKLAIATTAPEKNRELALRVLNLKEKFPVILGDEHVTHGKPDPEIYLETAKQLSVEPNECVVFEDTPPGVGSGKNAGMTVIGILTTHTPEQLNQADYTVNDFTEIEFK
jgi:beta-phosphoglucomutase